MDAQREGLDAAAERRTVTVLFADITGSTDSLGGHDVESVRSTYARVFERARTVINEHGGTVEKFIGDAIMAVFGVPTAHDDDAERAVRAAVALHELVTTLEATLPVPVRLRIGVNTGEVVTAGSTRQDLLVTGLAVNVAARLYPAAAPGTTLVGPLTRTLTEAAIAYDEPIDVAAKGAGSVSASRVAAILASPGSARRDSGLRAPLIGRGEELALLGETLRRTQRESRPHLVTVLGDAGVGKSRLIREFAASAAAKILVGRCLPYGDAAAFHTARSLVLQAVDADANDDPQRDVRGLRERIAASFPAGEGAAVADRLLTLAGFVDATVALPQVRADEVALELRWAMRRLLDRVAPGETLLLVLEDVHWATSELLDLIEDAAAKCARSMLICCLARPEFIDTRPGWGAQGAHASTIRLQPLDATRSRELVVELLRVAHLPAEFVVDVAERSGGNPLYVEELLRALIASGQLRPGDDGWEATAPTPAADVPESLRGIITARLDRLNAPARAVLQTGSVLGRYFSLEDVRALATEDAPTAGAAEHAVRQEFLIASDRDRGAGRANYWFRHALIRDAVYSSVPKRRRRVLHERAATWLELGGTEKSTLDQVAHHLEQSYLLAIELGDRDADSLGRRSYTALVSLALSLRQQSVHRKAAVALHGRAASIAARIGLSNEDRRDEIAWGACIRHFPHHGDADQSELFGALAAVRDLGPTTGLSQLLGLASHHAGERPARLAMAQEALDVARATGDPEAIGWGLWWVRNQIDPADHAQAWRLLEEVLAIGRTHRIPGLQSFALVTMGEQSIFEGTFSRALALLKEAHAIAKAGSSLTGMAGAALDLATIYATVHDRDPVRSYVDEGLAGIRETTNPPFIANHLWKAASIEQEIGDLERARAHGRESLDLVDVTLFRATVTAAHYNLALIEADLGELELARHHLDRMGELAGIQSRVFWLFAAGTVARAADDLGLSERQLRECLDEIKRRPTINIWGASTSWAWLEARVRELLADVLVQRGRSDGARAQFADARAFWSDPVAFRRRDELDRKLEALAD